MQIVTNDADAAKLAVEIDRLVRLTHAVLNIVTGVGYLVIMRPVDDATYATQLYYLEPSGAKHVDVAGLADQIFTRKDDFNRWVDEFNHLCTMRAIDLNHSPAA